MALLPFISLLVTEPLADGTSDTISDIPLDVRESSSYDFSSQVSENPIEAGSSVTDHVIKNPPGISLRGIVGEEQVGTINTTPELQGDIAGQVGPGTRCLKAFQALHSAWDNVSLLTVVTELGIFEDMVISSLSFPRSLQEGGNAIWFDLTLVKITIVETLTASLPPEFVAKIKRRRAKSKNKLTDRQKELTARMAKEVAGGPVSTTDATTAQTSQATAATQNQITFTSRNL